MITNRIKIDDNIEKIKSEDEIRSIIACYTSDNFEEMKRQINQYNARIFFSDLWRFLERQTWRDILNKYIYHVGITLQYWKTYK